MRPTEHLLHYAWKTRRFETQGLATTCGQPITVVQAGTPNPNQGPDFLHARIRLGATEWAGCVEMHVAGADWFAHNHHLDPAYNAVVLHAAWEPSTAQPLRHDGTKIPEVLLQGRLDVALLQQAEALAHTDAPFPCANLLGQVPSLFVRQWVHATGWERLQNRVELLEARLEALKHDWDQLIWAEWAGAMGGKVNRQAFQDLAGRLGIRTLQHHADDIRLLEAMLFGAAGFLEPGAAAPDDYCLMLQTHWQHLRHKFGLKPMAHTAFKFAKMRPAGFPTLRLAQLATMLHLWPSPLELANNPALVSEKGHEVAPSEYWLTHYKLGSAPGKQSLKPLGRQFAEHLMINCLVPVAMLYNRALNRPQSLEALMDLMQTLEPEDNAVVRKFAQCGFRAQNALESQGVLGLHSRYCQPILCLKCGIGHRILSKNLALTS